MNTRIALATAAAALFAIGGASAADTTAKSEARTDYRTQAADCTAGRTNQSQADCLKEARNAAADEARGKLDDKPASYDANAKARCDALPAAEQSDCLKRMEMGAVSGSVQAGGVIREHREVTVGTPTTQP